MSEEKKPPIGLVPRNVWLWERADEITRALDRYNCEEKVPPSAWVEELGDIYQELSHIRIPDIPSEFKLFPQLPRNLMKSIFEGSIVKMDTTEDHQQEPMAEEYCVMCAKKFRPTDQEVICQDCFQVEMEKD